MRSALVLLLVIATQPPLSSEDATKPIPPKLAPAAMTLPEGFRVTLFAGEPDLVQPIAFTFDDRGRLWVVECYSYPKWTSEKEGRDRVLILEDTDHDGTFDKRTVFWDRGANLSGIELGHGGVYLCASPNLLFIPLDAQKDAPAGPPKVLLDGWSIKAKHNVYNALQWGPDGWLYGCNGIIDTSLVGAPGTPAEKRTPVNCGVWRFHPVHQSFEVVAQGTTNPWGLDFDDRGEMWITNCVIKHIFHVVPGAHFVRMYGQDLNPHSYGLIESVADHIHWGGGDWTSSRGGKGVHSDAGGGHAHSGCMIYLGDNFPQEYRDRAFMCNIHGARLNTNLLERSGSSYVVKRSPDFLFANDPWFRGLAVKYGPDGGVYVSDWCDTGECHNYDVADMTNGRIFKVTYGQPKPFTQNLQQLSDADLVALQWHRNDFLVRHARRILQERHVAGKLDRAAVEKAARQVLQDPQRPVTQRLRALWCLYAIDALTPEVAEWQNSSPELRRWWVRLMVDRPGAGSGFMQHLVKLAGSETDPSVRLAIASAMQRVPHEVRWQMAEKIVTRAEDLQDHYLPMMIWYGVEPLPPQDPARARALISQCKLPVVRQYLTQRLAGLPGKLQDQLDALTALLGRDEGIDQDMYVGLREALKGQKKLPLPRGWLGNYTRLLAGKPTPGMEAAMQLTAQFGDAQALAALRATAREKSTPVVVRQWAVAALRGVQDAELGSLLKELFAVPEVRGIAIRGLASVNDPAVPTLLIENYSAFSAAERGDVINTLASRKEYATHLLTAVEKGVIPRQEVSVFAARQIAALPDPALQEQLARAWGQIRSSPKEKGPLTQKYQSLLSEQYLATADVRNGRKVYAANCASCHKMFDDGGEIGPALTGSQRASLDYILENVLDPAAVVAREYQLHELTLYNGRLVSGIIKQETDKVLVVQTANEVLNVAKEDIENRKTSKTSMMPEGLFDKLKDHELRDLIAYLRVKEQVPLPK